MSNLKARTSVDEYKGTMARYEKDMSEVGNQHKLTIESYEQRLDNFKRQIERLESLNKDLEKRSHRLIKKEG